MSIADNIARLSICCKEFIEIFQENNVPSEIIEKLNGLIELKEHTEFLEIALGFRKSMAFLNHEVFTDKLQTGWNLLEEGYKIEKKNIDKKIKALDPKADPDIVQKLNDLKAANDEKKAKALINCLLIRTELRIPLQKFSEDENFDSMAFYKANCKSETWINKVMRS